MFGSTTPAAPPTYQRHALGLPAGSIRALLALGILGLLWLLVLRYDDDHKLSLEFIYLEYLMLLMLASYFTAHGKTIGKQVSKKSPLGLPGGIIRIVLVVGYLGLAGFMWYKENYLREPYQFDSPPTSPPVLLILLLLSTFFLGYLLTAIVRWFSGATLPYAYQDIQAWVALLALIGMGLLAMWHVFISPTTKQDYSSSLVVLEACLAAVVGFYFGARS
jgi:putative Mn2+ efflux pump MntP